MGYGLRAPKIRQMGVSKTRFQKTTGNGPGQTLNELAP
jgi:hypothetical protein